MELADRLQKLSGQIDCLSDEDAKAKFLENLTEGQTITEAGINAGRTATWFRRRRNPAGSNFDPDFKEAYDTLMAPGGEYKRALVESITDAMIKEARNGNVRAQEKLLMAWSEEFQFLRPQVAQGDWNIDKLQVYLPNVSTETLLTMREELVKARELPVLEQ